MNQTKLIEETHDKNEAAWELFKEKLKAANWEYMNIEGFVNELKQSFSLSSLPKETTPEPEPILTSISKDA